MEPTNNPIEEYFVKQEGSKDLIVSKEIFTANEDNVDVKTDLGLQEINMINTLLYNNDLLKSRGMKPVYKDYLKNYMRLKISLDRKSRGEYVDINRSNDFTKNLKEISDTKNIIETKK